MSPEVELIYDADCPNVAAARSLLIRAFDQTGTSARWKEWERSTPDSPAHIRAFGSPTILVNGEDIAGYAPSSGARACRVYAASDGSLRPVPPLEQICAALLGQAPAGSNSVGGRGRWQAIAVSFPAIGAALLPKLTCPLCWPAYAAALSALGFGFFDYTPYLLPVTLGFLAVTLAALTLHAKRSGQRAPLLIGLAGAAVVLLGKFAFDLEWLNAAGVVVLVIAIFLTLLRRRSAAPACPACTGEGKPLTMQRS